jgi:predicted nucleic acid-binding protein
VIVVDSSAWIEFLRDTRSPVSRRLHDLIPSSTRLCVTELVVMEVLAGARSPDHAAELRERLLALRLVRVTRLAQYEDASALYRMCRAAGETVRKLTDCLIAVATIETGATLLTNDRDFEILARHSPLRLEPVPA